MQLAEKLLDRYAEHAVASRPLGTSVKEPAAGFRIILAEGAQSTEVFGANLGTVLDLDPMEAERTVDDEIDLVLGARLPVVQLVFAVGVITPGPQVLRDETFECGTVDVRRRIQRAGGTVGTEHSGVEVEKLGMNGESPLGATAEHGEAVAQEEGLPSDPLPQSLRTGRQITRGGWIEQIQAQGFGKERFDPRGLARAPWPEQEEMPGGRPEKARC